MGSPGTHWLTIGNGAVSYTQVEAEEVLAGFAFGTVGLAWTAPPSLARLLARDDELVGAPCAVERSRWAYRIYDCAPNSPHAFSVHDLLVAGALDARAGASEYLAMEAILQDLNEVLAHVDSRQTFWTLPCAALGSSPPPARTPAWWLWRAWVLLMGLDNVGVTITYKTLHHKRPWFFPIFDRATLAAMGGNGAWQTLHHELTTQAAQFEHLEQWFAARAIERGGVLLTRLRIHDILLWGGITDGGAERERLRGAGREVLDPNPSRPVTRPGKCR